MPIPDITDTQKLRMIPAIEEKINTLMLILQGDITRGEPGLLENIRNIKEDISSIRTGQKNAVELEKRVKAIEDRHAIIDAQKQRIDEQQKKWSGYQVATFSIVLSNVAIIIMWLMGFGR